MARSNLPSGPWKAGVAMTWLEHRVVAGRDAEPGGLVVEGGVVDEAGEHHAVDAVLARLGHRQVAAELLVERAKLLLHRADVVVGVDRAAADLGDVLAAECRGRRRCRSRRGRRRAPPSGRRSGRLRACCGSFRACVEFPAGKVAGSYALAGGVARGGGLTVPPTGGQCRMRARTTHAHRMHIACTGLGASAGFGKG